MTERKPNDDRPHGVHEVVAAAERAAHAAQAVSRAASMMGPTGARSLGRNPLLAILLFLALYFVARLSLESTTLSTATRMLIAVLPLPAFAWFLWAFINGIREADELERRIQLEALAVAFPLTLSLFMTLALMQIAVPLSPDDWSYRHTFPFIYVFYLVGVVMARRRYS